MGIGRAVPEEIFVGIADAQTGQEVAFNLWNPVVAIADKRSFGANNKIGAIRGEGRAGTGGEAGDSLSGGENRFQGSGQGAGNFRKLAFAEKVEVVTKDADFESIFGPMGGELEEEGFGKGAGGDAGGMKRLDEGEGLFDEGKRGVGGGDDFGKLSLEEAVFIQISNNFRGGGVERRIGAREGKLRGEVIREGLGQNPGFEKGLAGVEAGAIRAGGGDGPIRVTGREAAVVIFLGGELGRFRGAEFFLEDGVGLQLGLEKILQFEGGGLQELQGLLDLGRNRDGLAQAGLKGQRHGGYLDWAFPEKRQKVIWAR